MPKEKDQQRGTDPYAGETLEVAYQRQTDELLRLGESVGTPASNLLLVHAMRTAEDPEARKAIMSLLKKPE